MPPNQTLFYAYARSRFLAYCLYHSIEDRDIRSVILLLKEKKADPNHVLFDYGVSPVHLAASLEDQEFGIAVLGHCFAHGGDPNIKSSDGLTPVHIAAAWKRYSTLLFLTDHGGNPYIKDDDCNTAFDYIKDSKDISGSRNSSGFGIFSGTQQKRDESYGAFVSLGDIEDEEILSAERNVSSFDSVTCSNADGERDVFNEAFIGESFLQSASEYYSLSSSHEPSVSDIESGVFHIISECGVTARRFSSPLVIPYDPIFKINQDVGFDRCNPENLDGSRVQSLLDYKFEITNLATLSSSSKSGLYCEASDFLHETSAGSVSSCPTERLRKLLKHHDIDHGPLVKTTKKVYLYRLKQLNKNWASVETKSDLVEFNDVVIATFNGHLYSCIEKWSFLEEDMIKTLNGTACTDKLDASKKYFTYLLLDPSTSAGKLICNPTVESSMSWINFLKSIFYVGKGKNARPLDHLTEAMRDPKSYKSEKIKKIKNIWSKGNGVICVRVFHNICEAEALTREAAMISALNNGQLTNVQRGRFYGGVQRWSLKEKRRLGVVLLHRSMMMLLAEGERQIFPSDLKT